MISKRCSIITLLLLLLVSADGLADDWPQWMGPQRDNIWREAGIIDRFPSGGAKVLWRTKVAGGFAGPAVANGRVYVTDLVTADNVKVDNFDRNQFNGVERVLCLDAHTGEEIWTHELPVKYTMSYPAGPRCTPNVDGIRVYTLGGEGDLFCFDAINGDVVWSKNLREEYGAKTPLWGFAAHPLVDAGRLITLAGGAGSHVVALDKATGAEIWSALTSKEQGYSPPTIIEYANVQQLILARPDAVTSVDPQTGDEYWSVDFAVSNASIIMSPIHAGNLMFVGGFSHKNLLIELSGDRPEAKTLWRDLPQQAISPVNVQPMLDGDTLYGFHQNGLMYAVDIRTGQRIWQTGEPLGMGRPADSASAFIIRHEPAMLDQSEQKAERITNRYWLFTEQGDLVIAELSKDGYREITRSHAIDPSNTAYNRDIVWCAPAYAMRSAFIRNDNEMIRVDLSR